jgi:spore germination protein YaaH
VVLAWQWLGSTADYLAEVDAAPGLTVSSPLWWELDADGRLVDTSDPAFVAGAHRRGVAVWPALASLDLEVLHLALDDPADRIALAEAVSARAEALGVDGVNLDFEGYLHEDAAAVADFAALLGEAVRSWGGVLSVDLTVRSDDWVLTPPELAYWSTAPLRRELAEAADYVVLMAYDQHNKWRPAGPVAAPGWVEDVLRFQLRYVEPERVLLGMPFYGRVWDPDELDEPRAIGIGALERLAAGGERAPDPVFGVDRVDLDDGRFLWLEDAAGLAHRRRLVEEQGLAGLAGWRLGLDSPEVWPVLAGGGR